MPELILKKESELYKSFQQIIQKQKIVLFAGLPGVGKSLKQKRSSSSMGCHKSRF